jgi:heavy metal sensor kinase
VIWPRSIRLRLTLWYAIALAVVLIGYAGSVYVFLDHDLERELDRQVHEDYEAAEASLEATPDGDVRWRRSASEPEDELWADRWVEVRGHDGRVIHRHSPAVRGAAMIDLPEPHGLGAASLDLAPGLRVRLYQDEHRVGPAVVLVRAARSEERLRHELARLWLVLALGLPLGVGLASAGGWLVARRALRPLGAMIGRARDITADRLHERLPVDDPADELGQLGVTFNDVFERLERSFEQLRRFTGDASHELRTPLTALRTVGEVGLRDGATVEALRDVVGSMLEETDRLSRLVDALLQLARAEGGKVTLESTRVGIGRLAAEAVAQLGVLAEERGQRILLHADEDVFVLADPVVLRHAIVNVLDNAIKYGPRDSEIRVVAGRRGDDAEIAVSDAGPGIAPEHHDRVFERFYRVDAGRSRNAGGFGLGLALARWSAEAHGGAIELESVVGEGSTFRIVLPVAE